MDPRYDVVTVGRAGVDIYPLQVGVGLEDVSAFGKFLGGTAANVAVAAARHGLRAALVSRTGADPFGRFVHAALRELGVDDRYVTAVADLPTPVTFCEIFPPDEFPLYFYRRPAAPDMQLTPAELPAELVRGARLFWTIGSALSEEPSRSAMHAAYAARGRAPLTVLDLDYRPMFWPDRAAATAQLERALEHVTVAVGNLDECHTAVGERDPHRAAAALLERGLDLAVVKQGPRGVLARDPGRGGRGAAGPGGGRQRARRRRRVRRRAVRGPAGRAAAGRHDPVRQRGRRDRRLPAGVLHRHADHRRGGRGARGRRGRPDRARAGAAGTGAGRRTGRGSGGRPGGARRERTGPESGGRPRRGDAARARRERDGRGSGSQPGGGDAGRAGRARDRRGSGGRPGRGGGERIGCGGGAGAWLRRRRWDGCGSCGPATRGR